MNIDKHGEILMARAIELARRGLGTTHPNPRVGAVVVNHGEVVGEGWHVRAGGPHAEVVALEQAGERAKGGVLFVTLEPCSAHGRTPPCTEAIIRAGIRHVVFASSDPNPVMAGGRDVLRKAGIEVTAGVMAEEADAMNAPFFHYIRTGRAYVIAKAAVSLDGKLATHRHHSQWISCEASRVHAHELRAECDAILVGAGTMLRDNPWLTVRDAELRGAPPLRVVLCSETPLFDADSNLLRGDAPTRFYVHALNEESEKWRQAGVEIVEAERLEDVLSHLGAGGYLQLLLEGGGTLHTSFFNEQLSNELVLYQAPIVIGGRDAVSLWGGVGAGSVHEAIRLEQVQRMQLGRDMMTRGRLAYPD